MILSSLHVRLVVACLLGLTLAGMVRAQDSTADHTAGRIEFGIDPSVVVTYPIGEITRVRGNVPCSNELMGTTSVNAGLRIWGTYLFSRTEAVGVTLRGLWFSAGYSDLSSTFEAPDALFASYDPLSGSYTDVTTRHSIEYTLHALHFAAQLDLGLGGGAFCRLGPTLELPVEGATVESDSILAPADVSFLNGARTRTIDEGTGALDDPVPRFGVAAAFSYRLPLGRRVFFEPGVEIDYPLTRVQPEWSPLIVRAGIIIGLTTPPVESPALLPQAVAPSAIVSRPSKPPEPAVAPTMAIEADLPGGFVAVRREIVARYVPLLPVIFFDRDASVIPVTYRNVAPPAGMQGGTPTFQEENVSSQADHAHLQVLDIIGRRLKDNLKGRVTLTGATSIDEGDRAELARRRAEAVGEYLQQVWGIDERRMTIRSRLDPYVASNSEYEEGRAENRRVTIELTPDSLAAPVQMRRVEPVTDPDHIDFKVSIDADRPIDGWRVTIADERGAELRTLRGSGSPPSTVRWKLTPEERERMPDAGTVRYELAVYDNARRGISTPSQSLPLRVDTSISIVTAAGRPDNTAEFLLITFDFDRAELTRQGREELKTIVGRIGLKSRVEIIGYTDRTGDPARNRKLALERAAAVAALMPTGTQLSYRGAEPDEAPYDGNVPYGRFLSRTVRVVIGDPR